MTEIFLSISFGSEGVTLYDNTDILDHRNLVDSDLMTIAQASPSLITISYTMIIFKWQSLMTDD